MSGDAQDLHAMTDRTGRPGSWAPIRPRWACRSPGWGMMSAHLFGTSW